MKQNIAIGLAILALVVGIGGWLVNQPSSHPAGSLTGPDIQSPYLNVNGSRTWYSYTALAATSSSPCVIQNPSSATTTLVSFSLGVTANGMGAANFDLSTTTTAAGNASSTPAFIASGALGTGTTYSSWQPIATTTATTWGLSNSNTGVVGNSGLGLGQSNFIIAPNQYLTIRIATTSSQTYASYLTGYCRATFRDI